MAELVICRESDFTAPRDECPHPEYWTCPDDQATELEVIEGIGGLIRLLQPDFVLETGTHRGFMAKSIGQALKANGHGRLVTVEIDQDLYLEAAQRCDGLPVRCIRNSSTEITVPEPIDFAWFDSGGGQLREDEFRKFYPQMHARTIVGFHDTGEHHFHIRKSVERLEDEHMLVPIFLPTPRGVALCEVLV